MIDQLIVEPWDKWNARRCDICRRHGCSGWFHLVFTDGSHRVMKLCATSGMYEAAHKWTRGWTSTRQLSTIDLLVTLTARTDPLATGPSAVGHGSMHRIKCRVCTAEFANVEMDLVGAYHWINEHNVKHNWPQDNPMPVFVHVNMET